MCLTTMLNYVIRRSRNVVNMVFETLGASFGIVPLGYRNYADRHQNM